MGNMKLNLKIWRQTGPNAKGQMKDYPVNDVSPDMSFLEMLDVLNDNLVRKNETNKIQSTIQTSRKLGMITLDDALLDLVKRDKITRETALDAAQDPADLEARL